MPSQNDSDDGIPYTDNLSDLFPENDEYIQLTDSATEWEMNNPLVAENISSQKSHVTISQINENITCTINENYIPKRKSLSNTSVRKSVDSISAKKSSGSISEKKNVTLTKKSVGNTSVGDFSDVSDFDNMHEKTSMVVHTSRRSLGNTPLMKSSNKTKARESFSTFSVRASLGNTPAKKLLRKTPARKGTVNTPLRKSFGNTSAKKNLGNTSSKKSLGNTLSRKSLTITPARKSFGNTPARKSLGNISARKGVAYLSTEKNIEVDAADVIEEENHSETDTENELDIDGKSEGETLSSLSLIAAINNVTHINVNNFDESLNNIQKVVQALSCHSNVSTLGNQSSADMCMNAVKKLALTISMINAYHMYNTIIDDVSTFPLCYPSTSFESSRDNMTYVPRSTTHQSEEIDMTRISWFQDIMRNLFSNSVSNDYNAVRGMFRTHDSELNSASTTSSIGKRKSKRLRPVSNSKVPLRAIENAYDETPSTQKVIMSCISFELIFSTN